MNDWWLDPKLWVMAGGVIVQAGIVWWRVGEQAVRQTIHGQEIHLLKELRAGERINALETQVDSLREWRAQAREKIEQLEDRL